MKRSLYHTYQMNLGTSCLLNRTIPKNLSTKWGALHQVLALKMQMNYLRSQMMPSDYFSFEVPDWNLKDV